ncbi:unnamed protein product [Peronospora belbahrii]|uniref:BZIP domain-containing protein n=1 Tax=Peronospora belbahrii TaxID=622444 RepID=A0ABN8DC63_9STRA|nr:unnamed protein product [Peronospora belbahrii]
MDTTIKQEPMERNEDESKQLKVQDEICNQPEQLKQEMHNHVKPSGRNHYRSKSRNHKKKQQQQPILLKQLLWKAKDKQPTSVQTLRDESNCNERNKQEDDKVTGQKLVDENERETLVPTTKRKMVRGLVHEASSSLESFVAGSSSQETQSGSEDDVVFLRYSDLRPAVKASAKWQIDKKHRDGMEEIEKEESATPMILSDEVVTNQFELENAAATRRKQRQKYKLKQKQKRAAAKGHNRLQHQQKQKDKQLHDTEEDAGFTLDDGENTSVDNAHPPADLMVDASVVCTVLSVAEEVMSFIVVGNVACPVVADSDEQQPVGTSSASNQSEGSSTDLNVAIANIRQDMSTMLDNAKETQVQCRDSFIVEDSGFDAASSYDFFKHRFCKIQKSVDIVYY